MTCTIKMVNDIWFTNLEKNPEYINEYVRFCKEEWSSYSGELLEKKINDQVRRIINGEDGIIYVVLMLLKKELIGFISLFESDGDYYKELSPWFATFYVKEKYRNMGYSTLLFQELINESINLGYDEVFFRSYIENYYDRLYGAEVIDELDNGQKMYKISLSKRK